MIEFEFNMYWKIQVVTSMLSGNIVFSNKMSNDSFSNPNVLRS
jgi:hypothetical protein